MRKPQTFTPSRLDEMQSGRMADPITPGLYIEVRTGRGRISRVWKYRRRVAGAVGAHAVKATLGTYPSYSIALAREWAAKLNRSAGRGIHPLRAEAAERQSRMTVAEAHAHYLAFVRSSTLRELKPRSIQDKENIWTCDIKQQIGDKALAEVTDDDLWALVMAKGKAAPIRANRLAAELKVFMKWCVGRWGKEAGIPPLEVNPAATLEASHFKSKPRTRHLSHQELDWLLQALAPERRIYQRAILLLLLTGCRKEEVLGAEAREVVAGIWSIPRDRTKNSQAHRIPLAPWGKSLAASEQRWLIPSSRKDGPMLAGWYKVLDRIIERMAKIAGRPIPHFTYHDLRRTLRSNTRRLQIDFHTAEAMLNHKRSGLEDIYDGYDLFDEKREGFARWESFLVDLAIGAKVFKALSIPEDARPHLPAND